MEAINYNEELLASAIVEQAAIDYRKALCKYFKTRDTEALDTIENCERWFRGDYIKTLTAIDGNKLIDGIRQQCREFNYDIDEIKKSLAIK